MNKKTSLGVILNRTSKFELFRSPYKRRKHSDERKDNESSLNDNGKTR